MGLNLTTLTSVLLGIGLGVLAVSCLTVTIVFGRYANSFTKYQKYESKLSFDSKSSMIDSSIAIAVLGCISAVSALAAIVLSILIEGNNLILIIVGGISSLFAFGCIVAEGVYTQQSFNHEMSDIYSINAKSQSHRSARNYIKKSIQDLYEQAVPNLRKECPELEEESFPSWSSIKKSIGTLHSDGHLLTYRDLWNSRKTTNEIPIYFSTSYGLIYANANINKISCRTEVASYTFSAHISYKEKRKACWYDNKDRTSLSCKTFKNETYDDDNITLESGFLSEYITDGKYYSKKEARYNSIDVNYLVQGFPFAYTKHSYDDFQENPKGISDDSSRHYKVRGKNWAKAVLEDRHHPDDDDEFEITPSEPSSYQNIDDLCTSYRENKKEDDDDDEESKICPDEQPKVSMSDISEYIRKNYKDSAKGKIPPYLKKYYKKLYSSYFKQLSEYPGLYAVAQINLIIQIFAIILWACGSFLPNGKEKMPSEGEA